MIRGGTLTLRPTRTFTPCSRGGSGSANIRRGPDCLRKQSWRTNSAAGPTPTPGTLGVSVVLGCSAFRVLYVFLSLFSWWCRRRAGMDGTRMSRRVRRAVPRSAAPGGGGGSSFLTACIRGGELVEAGGEDGDLGFPGDGRLGAGGVREFRACLLGAPGVPLPSGDVQDVQRGAGGAVCCGGDRVQ